MEQRPMYVRRGEKVGQANKAPALLTAPTQSLLSVTPRFRAEQLRRFHSTLVGEKG